MKTLKITIAILAPVVLLALAFLRPKVESRESITTRPPLPMMIVVGDSNAVCLPPDILSMPADRCALNGTWEREIETLITDWPRTGYKQGIILYGVSPVAPYLNTDKESYAIAQAENQLQRIRQHFEEKFHFTPTVISVAEQIAAVHQGLTLDGFHFSREGYETLLTNRSQSQ